MRPHLLVVCCLFIGLFNLLGWNTNSATSAAAVTNAMAPEPGSVELDKAAQERAKWAFVPDPKLPNVLVIGDSISMGYTLPLRHSLEGVANVYHPMNRTEDKPTNCGPTDRGIKQMDAWLGTKTWQVIFFNFGLHDLEWHDDATGKYSDVAGKGHRNAPPDVYEKNLRQIVARLQKSGAKLIWATTTPVPANSSFRLRGDEVIYNQVAAKVMKDNNITICDLCAGVSSNGDSLHISPDNVHFNDKGYQVLAELAEQSIKTVLQAQNVNK